MYTCEKCNYLCKWKSEWSRHLGTAKHKNQLFSNFCQPEATEKSSHDESKQKYICNFCASEYKDKSGLWRHNKKCNGTLNVLTAEQVNNDLNNNNNNNNNNNSKTDIVLTLLKENQEFRNMMVEQAAEYKNIIAEQNSRIIELINKKNIVNHVTNNNQFNLNVFLNEICRDAMNMNDFIENIEIQMKELENVANNGYVVGISDIILSRLKQLDVSKRPLHCTDLKRETLYIKDQNEWNRDSEDNSKLKNMITKVARKNYRKIPKWREQNPECQEPENEKYSFCITMMRNSLGDLGDEQIRLDEKIVRNIAKQVIIDKVT